MTPLEALQALEAAAATVPEVGVFAVGEALHPPAVIVGPPVLAPLTTCPELVAATFEVTVAVALADGRRVLEALLALVEDLSAAVETQTAAAVTRAIPGTYTAGSVELPAYLLTVEFPL